jgi:hypothetical protein
VERCANGDQADTVAAADFTRPAHLLSLVYETDSASYVRGASFPDLGPFWPYIISLLAVGIWRQLKRHGNLMIIIKLRVKNDGKTKVLLNPLKPKLV